MFVDVRPEGRAGQVQTPGQRRGGGRNRADTNAASGAGRTFGEALTRGGGCTNAALDWQPCLMKKRRDVSD